MEPVKWHTIRSRIPIAFSNCKSNKHRNKFLFVRFVAIFFSVKMITPYQMDWLIYLWELCVSTHDAHKLSMQRPVIQALFDWLVRLSYISLLNGTYRLPNCHFSHSIIIIMIVMLTRALKKCADAIVSRDCCSMQMARSTGRVCRSWKNSTEYMSTRSLYAIWQ